MSAYVIVSYDIVDPEEYGSDVPAVMPLLAKHGAEVLMGSFDGETLEGEARGGHVVVRFATKEGALGWHGDPADGPVKQIRLNRTAYRRVPLVAGFEAPQG